MRALPDIAIGAVLAAGIAALASLLGLVISKEQKTSEFRQTWIDSLRNEIASLIAHANAIHGASMGNLTNPGDLWTVLREDYVGINDATAKIRLRLNPSEEDSQAVLIAISEMEEIISRSIDTKRLDETEKKLVADAQILLKREWLRVRKGEPTFAILKILLFIVVGSITAYLVALQVAEWR